MSGVTRTLHTPGSAEPSLEAALRPVSPPPPQGIARPLISGYMCALRLLTTALALRFGQDILGLLACARR